MPSKRGKRLRSSRRRAQSGPNERAVEDVPVTGQEMDRNPSNLQASSTSTEGAFGQAASSSPNQGSGYQGNAEGAEGGNKDRAKLLRQGLPQPKKMPLYSQAVGSKKSSPGKLTPNSRRMTSDGSSDRKISLANVATAFVAPRTLEDSKPLGASRRLENSGPIGASWSLQNSGPLGASMRQENLGPIGSMRQDDSSLSWRSRNQEGASLSGAFKRQEDSGPLGASMELEGSCPPWRSTKRDDRSLFGVPMRQEDSGPLGGSMKLEGSCPPWRSRKREDGTLFSALMRQEGSSNLGASLKLEDSSPSWRSRKQEDGSRFGVLTGLEDSGPLGPSRRLENSGPIGTSWSLENSGPMGASRRLENSGPLGTSWSLENSGAIGTPRSLENSGPLGTSWSLENSGAILTSSSLENSGPLGTSRRLGNSGLIGSMRQEDSTSFGPSMKPQNSSFFPQPSVDVPWTTLQTNGTLPLPFAQGGAAALDVDFGMNFSTRKESSSDESVFTDNNVRDRKECTSDIPTVETSGSAWTPWKSLDFLTDYVKSRTMDLPNGLNSVDLQNLFQSQDETKTTLRKESLEQCSIEQQRGQREQRNETKPLFSWNNVMEGLTNSLQETGKPVSSTDSPKPGMIVTPMRTVNFANLVISFSIQVYNLPWNCNVGPQMFEAIAETPTGSQIQCSIKNDPAHAANQFLGSFKATEEVGTYSLTIRLVMPFSKCGQLVATFPSEYGVVGDVKRIVVSRNYFKESLKTPPNCIQLMFQGSESHSFQPGPGFDDVNPADSKAWGLACDTQTNRIYYSERAGHRVSCLDSSTGAVLFQFNLNRADSKLNRPTGICCDEYNRRVIVCDKDNHRVSFFSMDGEYISSFGSPGYQNGKFNYPWDVATDSLGERIVISDSRNKRVQLFDINGNYLDKYSVFESNPFEYKKNFDYPRGVAFHPDDKRIYVTDFNTQNVIELPINFATAKRLCPDGKLRRPQGIVVDEIGSLIVADSRNHCIRHLTGCGQHLCTIHSIGHNFVEYPVNLTLMKNGNMAVLDGKGQIHMF